MITSSFLISFRLKQQVMVQTVDTLEQGISRKKYEKCQSCKGLRCWGCSFPFQPELSLPEKTRDLTRKVKETYSWGFSINLEDCVVNLNNFQLRNKKQFLCLEMQAFCFLFIFYFFFPFFFILFGICCLRYYSCRHPELFWDNGEETLQIQWQKWQLL